MGEVPEPASSGEKSCGQKSDCASMLLSILAVIKKIIMLIIKIGIKLVKTSGEIIQLHKDNLKGPEICVCVCFNCDLTRTISTSYQIFLNERNLGCDSRSSAYL